MDYLKFTARVAPLLMPDAFLFQVLVFTLQSGCDLYTCAPKMCGVWCFFMIQLCGGERLAGFVCLFAKHKGLECSEETGAAAVYR